MCSKWYPISIPTWDEDNVPSRLGGALPNNLRKKRPLGGATAPSVASITDGVAVTNLTADNIKGLNDVYGTLSRMWPLPPLEDAKKNKQNRSKKSYDILYKQLAEGRCEMSWERLESDDDKLHFAIIFSVRLLHLDRPGGADATEDGSEKIEDEDILLQLAYRLAPYNIAVVEMGEEARGSPYADSSILRSILWMDEQMRCRLTEAEQQRVAHRLILRFLREHGAVFCIEHPYAFYKICDLEMTGQFSEFSGRRIFRESLSVALVLADVAYTVNDDNYLNRSGHWTRSRALKRVGECIEAQGRYAVAALVYELGASVAISPCMRRDLHNCAGLVYQGNGQFDKAELHYLSGLREALLLPPGPENPGHPTDLRDINIPASIPLLVNMIQMYYFWRAAEGTLASPWEPWFCFLLSRNGLHFDDLSKLPGSMITFYESHIIMKKLTKNKAKRFLIEALQCVNVSDFHSKLLELKNMVKSSKSLNPPLYPIDPNATQVMRQKHKKHACAQINDHVLSGVQCYNKDCSEIAGNDNNTTATKFMACPCQSVCYCSTNCQNQHWPIHKLVCSYQKKRQQEKKDKKKKGRK